ncbi:MAG: glycosyltransferase family 2 protein [Flavobacteriales bacterium]|nr:glycosyltransferase family 2 protein [Flavobacteriales bacterium]
MANSVQISVVIITFNEERNISRCLASIADVADEIVVVDSFSTDDTKRICVEAGARFIEHQFDGHIEQKNWAITQANFQHVLSLDADEALDEQLKAEIIDIKSNWTHDGYSMNRLNSFCGKWIKHGGWYPDRKLRLWDTTKGFWGGINPHDFYQMKEGATTKHLNGDILHYTYYEIKEHIQQINYFTDISAKAYYQKGKRSDLAKIFFRPKFQFFKMFILKLGILDGYYGWVIARNSAHSTFLKYVKLREIQKKQ